MESGGGSRRRLSHSGEKLDSANLRDFLRVKEDDDGRNSYSGLTLSAVLGSEKRPSPAQVNRTLLDIIRDDPNSSKESKKSWKAFKDKLRLRRAGAAWTSTIPIPTSDVPFQNTNRMISRRQSTRFPTIVVNSDDPTSESTHPEISSSSSINEGDNRTELNSMPSNRAMMLRHNSSRIPSLAANRYGRGADGSTSSNTRESGTFENAGPHRRVRYMEEEDEEEEEVEEAAGESDESAEGAEEGGEPSVRMSLMALLAETDREMGLDESTYTMDDEEEEEEEEEEQREQESGGRGEYNNCCVCMVRHKGSAFIPCGHTFCRLCSRELWVQRGNCPLCNGFILEILDIF